MPSVGDACKLPGMSGSPPTPAPFDANSGESVSPHAGSTASIIAVVCAALGCVGWGAVLLLAQSTDSGEQLAQTMTSLVNAMIVGVIGGPSLLLSLVALWLQRRATRLPAGIAAKGLGIIGLVLAVVALVFRGGDLIGVLRELI